MALLNAFRRIGPMAAVCGANRICLDIKGTEISLISGAGKSGKASEIVAADKTGDQQPFALNCLYVSQALSSITTENVLFKTACESLRPVGIFPDSPSNHDVQILMPMQVV
jgi:DNA polymerase III sliding clamp (beta) subunit (PCNA family)